MGVIGIEDLGLLGHGDPKIGGTNGIPSVGGQWEPNIGTLGHRDPKFGGVGAQRPQIWGHQWDSIRWGSIGVKYGEWRPPIFSPPETPKNPFFSTQNHLQFSFPPPTPPKPISPTPSFLPPLKNTLKILFLGVCGGVKGVKPPHPHHQTSSTRCRPRRSGSANPAGWGSSWPGWFSRRRWERPPPCNASHRWGTSPPKSGGRRVGGGGKWGSFGGLWGVGGPTERAVEVIERNYRKDLERTIEMNHREEHTEDHRDKP